MLAASTFREMWSSLGAKGPWQPHYGVVLHQYEQPHRCHHGSNHPVEVMALLDEYIKKSKRPLINPIEARAVIVWHDAVYDTHRKDNEEQSADLCYGALTEGGVSQRKCLRIHRGILGTKHDSNVSVEEAMWPVMDADMAILGAPWLRYLCYMRGIEAEYRYGSVISELDYLHGRRNFLYKTLEKPHLFRTTYFDKRYNKFAQRNMNRELTLLGERLKKFL